MPASAPDTAPTPGSLPAHVKRVVQSMSNCQHRATVSSHNVGSGSEGKVDADGRQHYSVSFRQYRTVIRIAEVARLVHAN